MLTKIQQFLKFYWYTFVIIVAIIIADLITKAIAFKYLNQTSVKFIGNFLRFTRVENRGVAFGFLAGQNMWVIHVITIIIIISLVVFLYGFGKKYHKLLIIGISLIIGGGIGNLVDRISLGYVRDFIDWWVVFPWARYVFNIADSATVIGWFVLMGYFIFENKLTGNQDK